MTTTTGRTFARRARCPSCDARQQFGEPKISGTWPARLRLTQEQIDLLLVAAAEFRDICDELGEYEEVVGFVDWIAPDALGKVSGKVIEAEGVAIMEGGFISGSMSYRHTSPDPLPVMPRRKAS
jgi:hypothetical protein